MPQQRRTPQEVALLIQSNDDAIDDLSDAELRIGLAILDRAEAGVQQPPQGGALQRGASAFNELAVKPAVQIGGDVGRSVNPFGGVDAQVEAQNRLASIPGEVIKGQAQLQSGGFDKILEAIGFSDPTTELTERGSTGAFETGFLPQEGRSQSERVKQGLSGLLDVGASFVPFGAAARAPSAAIEEGDLAGAVGGLLGLAAPKGIGTLSKIPRSRPGSGTTPVTSPKGTVTDIPVTRGQSGGPIARTVEAQARGSRLAGEPLRKFDRQVQDPALRQAEQALLDDLSPTAPDPAIGGAATARVGRRAQAAGQQGIAELESTGKSGLDAVDTAVQQRGLTGQTDNFRAFKEQELPRRAEAQQFQELPGSQQAIRQLESGSNTKLVADFPEEVRPLLLEQLGTLDAAEPPLSAMITTMRLLREQARRVERSGEPGISGGQAKAMAAALAEDVKASLEVADPALARQFTEANRQLRTSTGRSGSDISQSLEGSQTQNVAKNTLLESDVADIGKLRRDIGPEKFNEMSRQLVADELIEGTGPDLRTQIPEGSPFAGEPAVRVSPFDSLVNNLTKGGRGNNIFGKNAMRAMRDLRQTLKGVAESRGTDSTTFIGRMIDAGATSRAAIGVGGGVVGGALLGAPLEGAALGATAAFAPPVLMNIAARILVKPKGANILQNFAKATGNASREAFWAQRLGEFIEQDPEIKALVDEGR